MKNVNRCLKSLQIMLMCEERLGVSGVGGVGAGGLWGENSFRGGLKGSRAWPADGPKLPCVV